MVLLGMLSIKKFAQENKKISAYTPEGRERFYQNEPSLSEFGFGKARQHIDEQTPKRLYPFMIGVGEHDCGRRNV